MKRLMNWYLLTGAVFTMNCQELQRDSIRKHEISLNMTPALQLLTSAMPTGNSHFSLDYYHYLKSPLIYHIGLSVFPFMGSQQYNPGWQYHNTVGNKNVFYSYSYNPHVKIQLSTGLEVQHRWKRFAHGFGGDLLVGFQKVYYHSNYTWAFVGDQPFEHVMQGDTTNHTVDSLGYSEDSQDISAGVHLFYSLRYQFTKRFCLMVQAGPSLAAVFSQRRKEDYATDTVINSQVTYLDFAMPFVSRISIGFRF